MSGRERYSIEISPQAFRALDKLRDKKAQNELIRAIDQLASRPHVRGKALMGPLAGIRSIRAVKERYRILYRVEDATVSVLLIGLRRPGHASDVYAIAESLVRMLLGRRGR